MTVRASLHALRAAPLAWAITIPLAAAARAGHDGREAGSPFAATVYAIGRFICHQRPERSFQWASVSWPVCARCTGLYAGAAMAALALFVIAPTSRIRLSPAGARLWMAAAASPAVASLLWEWTTGSTPSNLLRAATGLPLGAVGLWIVYAFLREGDATGEQGEPASSRTMR